MAEKKKKKPIIDLVKEAMIPGQMAKDILETVNRRIKEATDK